jgi:hypothetical protein
MTCLLDTALPLGCTRVTLTVSASTAASASLSVRP